MKTMDSSQAQWMEPFAFGTSEILLAEAFSIVDLQIGALFLLRLTWKEWSSLQS